MEFKSTKEFIYKTTGARISKRIKELNISHRSIYDRESKLIGRIRNGKAVKERNPYLLRNDVQKELKNKLCFRNDFHLLWGTKDEVGEYLLPLFQSLIFDMISSDSIYLEVTKDALCSYFPYARWSAYEKVFSTSLLLKQHKYPIRYYYGIDDGDAVSYLEDVTADAIFYLFGLLHPEFERSFINFAKHTDSYKKFDRKISEWVEQDLIPLLKNCKPSESSLNARIRRLVEEDYIYIPYINESKSFSSQDNSTISDLIHATYEYVEKLEEIQSKFNQKKQHQMQML